MSERYPNGLFHRRRQLGMSQASLAEKIGVTDAIISQYELGRKHPRIQTIQKLLEALNSTFQDIWPNKKPPISEEPAPIESFLDGLNPSDDQTPTEETKAS